MITNIPNTEDISSKKAHGPGNYVHACTFQPTDGFVGRVGKHPLPMFFEFRTDIVELFSYGSHFDSSVNTAIIYMGSISSEVVLRTKVSLVSHEARSIFEPLRRPP